MKSFVGLGGRRQEGADGLVNTMLSGEWAKSEFGQKLAAALTEKIGGLTTRYDYLVEGGWKLIVLDRARSALTLNGSGPERLHFESGGKYADDGYAEAEIETLKFFGSDVATYPVQDLGARVSLTLGARRLEWSKDMQRIIFDCVDATALPRNAHEWLKDVCGLAPRYGGLRVLYDEPGVSEKRGELLIGFSGAGSNHNLLFSVGALAAAQEVLAELWPHVRIPCNLEELKMLPTVRLWLDVWGIEEIGKFE